MRVLARDDSTPHICITEESREADVIDRGLSESRCEVMVTRSCVVNSGC